MDDVRGYFLIPRNVDNPVPWKSISLSREIIANWSFWFWAVPDKTVSRDSFIVLRGSVLVPMTKLSYNVSNDAAY